MNCTYCNEPIRRGEQYVDFKLTDDCTLYFHNNNTYRPYTCWARWQDEHQHQSIKELQEAV